MSHKQQLEKHFKGLSEETIIDTLRLMDNITYTPDFYDYVAADVYNVISILLFYKPSSDFFINNVYSKTPSTDCKFDIEHFNYHEKLDELGIYEPTDLQKRYLIFPSFNELTGNLRIVYFYNNVLSGNIPSVHITSLYSEKTTLINVLNTFVKDISDITKDQRTIVTQIERKAAENIRNLYEKELHDANKSIYDKLKDNLTYYSNDLTAQVIACTIGFCLGLIIQVTA